MSVIFPDGYFQGPQPESAVSGVGGVGARVMVAKDSLVERSAVSV